MRTLIVGHCQRGAVAVTFAMCLLVLLGFMAIALDFGHLFVVKTELQTAMDSCALSAAQELDGRSDALTRANNAGMTAGNANSVNFQSATWSGKGKIIPANITFKDAAYLATTAPAAARYAQCAHTQAGVNMWLLQAMGAATGNTATYTNTQGVGALAVATRASAQSTCPIPLAIKPKPGSSAPNYGFAVGEWVRLLMTQNAAVGGEIGWANLDGTNSASETEAELNGFCGTTVGNNLGTPGVQTSVADVWNYRFGIYTNSGNPAINKPDFTGYAYTLTNWPSGQNAYAGSPGANPTGTAANFLAKRAAFASCADTGTKVKGANSCESITGLSLNSFQKLAAPGNAAGGHRDHGISRRIVTVPVINGSNNVVDFVCMLMLQPLSIPLTNVQLEFRGNAADIGSGCTTSGFPGGSSGPLVPVLVR